MPYYSADDLGALMLCGVSRVLSILLAIGASSVCPAVDYLRDVKPLLKHKCYACHGGLKQQSGLRLDTASSLITGGDSGAAVTPGKPDQSLLVDVVTGDAGFRMPPENEGTMLSDQEVDLIRQWIASGAAAPDDEQPEADPRSWWSYRKLQRPTLPNVGDATWCRNEIDHFVSARRTRDGLPYAAEASKEVWLRRVFLDLIGLPPTRAEQQRFLSDQSPAAWETVVDDLLSRPQYGERWGRHWMDIWRYSDWYGSRGGNEIRYSQRHIWRWRDWIVSSLNEDKGYDQMIREMLAADEIAGDDPSVLSATGFLGRNWYKFDRDVWLFDTVERTGEAMLGLTFRCCRCHDHKYDPITQEEYYRFRAFFEPHDVRTDPISALTGTQKDSKLGQVLNDGIARVYDKALNAPTYRLMRGDSRHPDQSQSLTPGIPSALGGEIDIQSIQLPAEAWYPALRAGMAQTIVAKAKAELAGASAKLRQVQSTAQNAAERLTTASAVGDDPEPILQDDFAVPRPATWQVLNGTWEYTGGKLVQSAVTSFATLLSKQNVVDDFHVHLRYRPLSAGTYRSVGFSFDYIDNGNSQDVYTSTGDNRQSVQAFHRIGGKQVYPPDGTIIAPLTIGEEVVLDVMVSGSSLTIDLNGERKLDYVMSEQRRDGKFALWVHQGAAEFREVKITKLAESAETLARRKRDAELEVAIAESEVEQAVAEVIRVEKRLAADVERYNNGDSELATRYKSEARQAELDLAVLRARAGVLKAQGSPDKLQQAQQKLSAATAAANKPVGEPKPLGPQYPQTSTGRRTALADWIVNADNPRTARVAANHIWGRHFGQPLVATPENFGLNGAAPTHPRLLDWLATELIANGWKMKPLHKQLVMSATYRMASTPKAVSRTAGHLQATSIDGKNRLLWRMNSRRMEAELVRDSALYVANQLDMTQGGPELPETDGEQTLRRSLYFRNTPNEKMLMLEVFDVADPNACYQRKESIVPAQSLAMMNSGLIQDAARKVAQRLSADDDFVAAAFETVLARGPSEAERQRCQEFLENQTEHPRQSGEPAYAAGGSAKVPPSRDPTMRAKENLIHVLFLHNDFVTIR